VEYGCFRFTKSEPVTIFFDKFDPIPFPDPVSEIIPDHCSNGRKRDSRDYVVRSPKSSNKNHNIHPRYSGTDNRERFDTSRKKGNKIIPISKSFDKFPNPSYSIFYPLWSDK
jgi:hypothetical protein